MKRTIAIVAGGDTSEFHVSLRSAQGIAVSAAGPTGASAPADLFASAFFFAGAAFSGGVCPRIST